MWKEAANDMICELSDQRNELDANIADLEHAIETNDKVLYLKIRDDYEDH